jgi:hypothetical protein
LEQKLQNAERIGDTELENVIMQQKSANDFQDMELQRDKKELETRMRREAKEAQEVEAERSPKGSCHQRRGVFQVVTHINSLLYFDRSTQCAFATRIEWAGWIDID